jgi:hypothetical protein
LLTLESIIRRAAATARTTLNSQGALDLLLAQTDAGNDRNDLWDRPLRLSFVSPGVFHVISDGPDKKPNTTDDMSTAEPFKAYDQRVFGDLF